MKLGYRPVRMQTLTNEVSVFPPKKRERVMVAARIGHN